MEKAEQFIEEMLKRSGDRLKGVAVKQTKRRAFNYNGQIEIHIAYYFFAGWPPPIGYVGGDDFNICGTLREVHVRKRYLNIEIENGPFYLHTAFLD